jgi:hypothetical protein
MVGWNESSSVSSLNQSLWNNVSPCNSSLERL